MTMPSNRKLGRPASSTGGPPRHPVNKRPRHIGIVAVTAEGAALCYRTICEEAQATLGNHAHPEVTLHTFSLADYMAAVEADQWERAGRMMLASAAKLQQTGAEFAICPDNTLHQGLDLVRADSPIPWLHIAEEIAALASSRGYKKVGVLGTRWLMEGPVYRRPLQELGIEMQTPPPDVRERMNSMIMDEMVHGRFDEPVREYYREAIRQFHKNGCQAAVLGCTEIPILIADSDSVLPTLDSTRTLARAALREALAK